MRIQQLAWIVLFTLAIGPSSLLADDEKKTETKFIPLPIYSTLPNEGSTFGFMPVFLVHDKDTQFTESIFAPSVSWNATIKTTGTFRWYHYPSPTKSFTLIPSVSSHVNRRITILYSDLPVEPGSFTTESAFRLRRDIFYRFFGLGPDTNSRDESSYTRLGGDTFIREGYNIIDHLNVGVTVALQRDLVESIAVSNVPVTTERFPGTPGLGGSTVTYQGLSVRYDTRDNKEYSTYGWSTELSGGLTEGLSGTTNFSKVQWESRGLYTESDSQQTAARLFWTYAGGHDTPFYDQSSLGGSYRLRGFTDDRFIDKGAWEAEIEQRISVLTTHIYGVTADWRIDPFVTVGQVYQDLNQIFHKPHAAAGLGFRAWVHPNVLGRVDTAYGGEGLKVYVELGYPF